jgi:hypothetical protein
VLLALVIGKWHMALFMAMMEAAAMALTADGCWQMVA